ncbi:MAG: hypothetical protein KA120_07505 [Candidatus Goldbacteria bacterium]|nr:hypothetical protein [Candidatus Goldiibacteriota bacterium]
MKKSKVLKTFFCIIVFLILTNKTFSQMAEKINYEIIKIPRIIQGKSLGERKYEKSYSCYYDVEVSVEEDGSMFIIDSVNKWIVKYNLKNSRVEKVIDLNKVDNKNAIWIADGQTRTFKEKIYIVSNIGLIEFNTKNYEINILNNYKQVIIDAGDGTKYFHKGREIRKEYAPDKKRIDFTEKGIDKQIIKNNNTEEKIELSNKEMYKIVKRTGVNVSMFDNAFLDRGILYRIEIKEGQMWIIKDDINKDKIILEKKLLKNIWGARLIGAINNNIYIHSIGKDNKYYIYEIDNDKIVIKRKIEVNSAYPTYCGGTTRIIGPTWNSFDAMGKDDAFYVSGPFSGDELILYKYNIGK